MFGFDWPEFAVLGLGALVFLVIRGYRKQPAYKKEGYAVSNHKCMTCGYVGPMKTWYDTSFFPALVTLLGFLFFFIPGLIFLAWAWGRLQCPQCRTLGKSRPAMAEDIENGKKCPYCAETIKREAVICRFCNHELEIDITPTSGQ